MPHSFSYAVSMNLEHSIKEGSHERYPDHFQCFRNIKKIKYPDFQAMTDIKAKQCKTIVTFDTIPESKILDAGDLLILSNLQKPWTIACKDISRVFEIEYSTYRILNRSELCECSLTAGNYLLSYMNINCGNAPEARDGCFTTYYSFNKIVLDVITEKFNIQLDDNTRNQAALLHDDIPGYDLPTIDFVQTITDQDKDVSILEEDNSQIYIYFNNVLVHMTTNKQPLLN